MTIKSNSASFRLSLVILAATLAVMFFSMAVQWPPATMTSTLSNHHKIPVLQAATPDSTLSLIAVGDIMLSRNVEQKMIKQNDWRYPFRETYRVTTTGDIIFGNLESPLIEGPIVQTGEMVFRADPKSAAGLQFAGFTVLSLANNHLMNKGTAGLKKTIETLDRANIAHAGAGTDSRSANYPAILTVKGKKVGFLAYTDSAFTPAGYEATPSKAGCAFMDVQTMQQDITDLKKNVDIIVVSMHAGTEYATQPNEKQKAFARTAIDNGAALVIGHHPHVLEPYERYQEGYILYSLGNFVFDQMWSEPTREGAIANITFTDNAVSAINFVPIKIFYFSQPRLLSDSEGQPILDLLNSFTK